MKRTIEETPAAIVEDGRIATGVFRAPFRVMNLRDAAIGQGPLRRLRLKEWLGFGIVHPEWHFTVFMVDAKYLAAANCYAFDRRNKTTVKHARSRVDGRMRIAANLYADRCEYKTRGFRMEFRNRVDSGVHEIKVDIKATRRRPAVLADITLSEDLSLVQPLVVSMPLARGHSAVTHKAPMRAAGVAVIGGEEITFDPARDIALMDEHKSYLPYRIVWRWATLAGYDAKGRLMALNLGDHDSVEDQRAWNENCLWLDGKLSLLGPVEFEFDPRRHMEPWTVREADGRAEVQFRPEGDKIENVSLGPVGMRYFQPCGTFSGYAVDDAGERIEFDNFYGVAEMMDARW